MTVSLDDLLDVFYENECKLGDREAIAAVVIALKPEFAKMHSCGESGAGFLGGVPSQAAAQRLIDEILGKKQ